MTMGALADYYSRKENMPQLKGPDGGYLRQQFPTLYGYLAGLVGTAPDEVAGSVLDPNTSKVKEGADATYYLGTLLNMLPMAKGLNAPAAAVGKTLAPAVERAVPAIMERGGLPAEMLQAMASKTESPMIVWHGSPHKFDKFDASKIGTGEGAQAYGHGLYVAESPEVAESYMNILSGNQSAIGAGYYPKVNSKVVYDDFDDLDIVRKIAAETQPKPGGLLGKGKRDAISSDDAISNLIAKNKEILDNPVYFDSAKADAAEEIEALQRYIGQKIEPSTPSLYKIDLPDEHIAKMLDWDKPLSQQHPDVQKALLKQGIGGSSAWDEITGPNLINQLGERLGGKNNSVAASEFLQQQGIPGIRYLDGGSRGTGAGTSNFVIFPGNEGALTILERNGQPLFLPKE